ncbi:MAG: sensor histidine kinase [Planctomycetaceae bacterium]
MAITAFRDGADERTSVRRQKCLARGLVGGALVVLLLSQPAQALDPDRTLTQALVRKWQSQQGLPQATIFRICQTSDRVLWLGTQSGLFRFDGLRFVGAKVAQGVSPGDLAIRDVCEDRERNLWVATSDAGVIRLHEGNAVGIGRQNGLPSDNVRCLLADRRGDVWIGTDEGLARWTQGEIISYGARQGLPANDVRAICEDDRGKIWIGCATHRLGVWDGSALTQRELASLPAGTAILALLATPGGVIWAGSTAGLVRIDGEAELRIGRRDGLADDVIECLAASHGEAIWVGTRDGFSRISGADHGADIESFRTRDGLSQSTVLTLCEDHEGSLWAGTKHGLNQFLDRRLVPLTVSEGLPSNDTGPILQDHSGATWVGTLGKGLARFDGRRCFLAATLGQGLSSDTILALADAGDGRLWVGTDRGLCILRDGRVESCYTTEQGLPSNRISALCHDSLGTLWAGTDAGLVEHRGERFVPLDRMPLGSQLPILALVPGGDGSVLAAAGGGWVVRGAGRSFEPVLEGGRLASDIGALFEDREGAIWIGTRGSGLSLLDGGKLHHFTVRDGLYDDEISGIVADDRGTLWMACSQGIFSLAPADVRQFMAGKAARLSCTPYSPTDALRTVECQSDVQPVVWKMRDGTVWFSTNSGVLIVDPGRMRRDVPPPAVCIEEVQVNGRDVDLARTPRLAPGLTNLYFRYTALSYASPARTKFRCKLEGFDKDWVHAGARREAFYTNLPPGKYRFLVNAAASDGAWNESGGQIEFSLEPHLYQQPWFIASIIGLTALGGGLAWRLRGLQMRAQMRAVIAERSRIARELHDTLIQGFSGVTMQMQALAARLPPSSERATLESIVQDAGLSLRDARRTVGGLRNGQGTVAALSAAIAQAARQLTEAGDAHLVLHLQESSLSLPVHVEYDMLRIVQEAITNAVKHSGAARIEVVVECTPQRLCVAVSDDGAGFNVAACEGQSGHYGLVGMRERAAHIKAELLVQSAAGQGTKVRLVYPLASTAGAAPTNIESAVAGFHKSRLQ